MKKTLGILSLLLAVNVYGTGVDTLSIKSHIEDVTVFFQGAQITREAKINVTRGKYLFVIDKLPAEINPHSIQVDNNQKGKILSVKHELTYPNKKSETIVAYEAKIEVQENRYKEITSEINVFEIEEKILLDNSNLAKTNNGTTISEIKEASTFYRLKLNEIRKEKLKREIELDLIKQKIKDLYMELNKIVWQENKTYSKISITIDCEATVNTNFNISYYVTSAGWDPLYDFRVKSISAPLNVIYNSIIYQSTGESWNNVNLTLSTNAPSVINRKPELNTWYINRRNTSQEVRSTNGQSAIKGAVKDPSTGESIPFANVVVSKNGEVVSGAITDFDGNYIIKPISPGTYSVKVTVLGYEPMSLPRVVIAKETIKRVDIQMKSTSVQLDEFVVSNYKNRLIDKDNSTSSYTVSTEEVRNMARRSKTGVYANDQGTGDLNIRGARSGANYYYIDGMKVSHNGAVLVDGYNSNTNVTSLEYKIDIPYSIPSDGKDYTVKIKEVSLPVEYVFYSTPKIEKDVFLVAKINGWNQLNLLSGDISVYYQGVFTGQSEIDANSTKDTLSVSLNRDKNIMVERTFLKEKSAKQLIGKNIKETITWSITVKNNKDVKTNIVLEDQFPVSELETIEIEKLEFSNGKVNDKTGKVIWDLELEPNEKKELILKYSVKYPNTLIIDVE